MLKAIVALSIMIFAVAAAGCQSTAQFLDSRQPLALQNAADKGRYELGCQKTTEALVSRKISEPSPRTDWMSGVRRAEYTIDVEGCSRKLTYLVICPQEGEGCFATSPGTFSLNGYEEAKN